MLVLSRKPDQSIHIGDNIKITVVQIKGNQVRIAIDAPQDVRVLRSELCQWWSMDDSEKAATPKPERGLKADDALLGTLRR